MTYTPPKITLKAARINAGLHLEAAAKLIGVSIGTLHNWEKDSTNIKINKVEKIEEVYGYPSDFIFFGKSIEFNSTEKEEVK